MQVKKFWAVLLAAILIVSCLAGCSSDGGNSTGDSSAAGAISQAETGDESQTVDESDPYAAGDFTYPMDGTVTLSINLTPTAEAELPEWVKGHYFWDVIQEKTGVNLEFIGSASSPQETSEAFSLLLTSGEYPDIMQANWITFKGGRLRRLMMVISFR